MSNSKIPLNKTARPRLFRIDHGFFSGKNIISILAISGIIFTAIISGCAPTQMIADKSGAQLWGENCNRCHNSPSKDQYTPEQWEVITTHMKVRANVTDDEVKKIVGFLQGVSL